MPLNQSFLLDNRPQGQATIDNFRLVSSETPALEEARSWCATTTSALTPTCVGA